MRNGGVDELARNGAGPASVVLIEDDDRLRRLVRLCLADHPTLRVVADASDGTAGLAACVEHRPRVVVLDLELPDIPGTEVLARLQIVVPSSLVVIFTGAATPPPEVTSAWGAAGYVVKGGGLEKLIGTLERVAAGQISASIDLDYDLATARAARRFVERTLTEWACEGLTDTAVLVVSELVTNAVTHAASRCTVTLRFEPGSVTIEVVDFDAALPEPQSQDPERPSGRGLTIVAALSEAWGVDRTDSGKRVWATLSTGGDWT